MSTNSVEEINAAPIDRKERMKQARNVMIIGLVLNLVLAAAKISISVIFGSIALQADGLDSALTDGNFIVRNNTQTKNMSALSIKQVLYTIHNL